METEESTSIKTEDETETYNYPASDLLRNDVSCCNNIFIRKQKFSFVINK